MPACPDATDATGPTRTPGRRHWSPCGDPTRTERTATSQSYAQRAREHWATHRPHQLSLMPDPDVFFTELGRETQERVDVLSSHLEGPDVPGEGYLGKVGRLRMARFTAQAQALRELLPPAERDELPDRAPEHLTPTDSATFWPSSTPPPVTGWLPVEMSPDHPRYQELDEDLGLRRV